MANLPDNPQTESTLAEVIRKLDELAAQNNKLEAQNNKLEAQNSKLEAQNNEITAEVEKIAVDMKQFDQRFADYRQATQWVVQLAFTLIASATITVILTSIFKK
jgi:chromosome segregation ATPase